MRERVEGMRFLDLFCGAGGAAMGLHRAFPDALIVGIDIRPQPHYPFTFIQGDALKPPVDMSQFDFIWASPMCQGYSLTQRIHGNEYPRQVENIRAVLISTNKPYVIENVPQAPLNNPVTLCGTMFGLPLIRHRAFECNPPVWFVPASCACSGLYTNASRGYSSFENGATAICVAGNNFNPDDGAKATGIDWMTRDELAEAIPPAYSEYLIKQIFPQRISVAQDVMELA